MKKNIISLLFLFVISCISAQNTNVHDLIQSALSKDSTENYSAALKDLNKAHIVQLIVQLGLEKLFTLTHSCVYDIDTPCGDCNRCNERAWAFTQLGLIDPSTK